jgi:hypothetical protein
LTVVEKNRRVQMIHRKLLETGPGLLWEFMALSNSEKNTFTQVSKSNLYKITALCNFRPMIWKKLLPLVPALLLTGCASQFTRLTPLQQPRNPNNLYPVEVQFNSKEQAMRWDTIKPYVEVNGQLYPLRPEPLVQHRWEGYVPVPAGANEVEFRFKFDYTYNAFKAQPGQTSALSPTYKLKITE